MPRVPDLGITLGLLPPGPTGSVLDVPGAGLGHATVWRDEPPPPGGRGTARTGVTVIDPGGDLFRFPVPAGGAVLSGAGECTGMLAAAEWGLAETPVFLTSTMQLGRVYDAACELLIDEQPAIGEEDVIIPIVAECDDSFLSESRRMQVQPGDVREALAAARASAGAVSGPGRRGRRGHRDELPGLQGRHRHRVPGGVRRGDRRGGHDDQLRRPGTADRGRGAGRAAAARSRGRRRARGNRRRGRRGGPRPPAGPRGLVHRGDPHRRAARRGGLPAAGPPGRAGPGPGGQHRAPRQRGDLPGPGHRAPRAARAGAGPCPR